MCVCVCVEERGRERGREGGRERGRESQREEERCRSWYVYDTMMPIIQNLILIFRLIIQNLIFILRLIIGAPEPTRCMRAHAGEILQAT